MSVKYYRDLLAQRERIEPFRKALHDVIRPGDRVLEIGTGLGTFAFFAADAGAARVWGVEGNAIVHVAQTIARVNGYADRVELIRGWIPEVTLPELADVLVFEDFPPRLVDEGIFGLLRQLHERYVVPDVRAVPRRARFFLAPVSSDTVWNEVAFPGPDDEAYGIHWGASRSYVENTPLHVAIPADALAAEPAAATEFRFDRSPEIGALEARARWTLDSTATLHGLAYWFDLELAPGAWLSNAPGAWPASWGHLFLPLPEPVTAERNASLQAVVAPERLPHGGPGWLRWELTVEGRSFRGHEFAGEPASLGDLLAGSPDGVPVLTRAARIEAAVLDLTDGERTVADIAVALRSTYPEMSGPEAERLVAAVLVGRASAGLRTGSGTEVVR